MKTMGGAASSRAPTAMNRAPRAAEGVPCGGAVPLSTQIYKSGKGALQCRSAPAWQAALS